MCLFRKWTYLGYSEIGVTQYVGNKPYRRHIGSVHFYETPDGKHRKVEVTHDCLEERADVMAWKRGFGGSYDLVVHRQPAKEAA